MMIALIQIQTGTALVSVALDAPQGINEEVENTADRMAFEIGGKVSRIQLSGPTLAESLVSTRGD